MEFPTFLGILRKLLLKYFSLMFLILALSLSVRTLYHSLVIEALLTSSFFLMPSPPLNIGLQVTSHATKGIPLVSLGSVFGVHKRSKLFQL